MAETKVTTAELKPSTINFVDSGGSNFTTTSASLVDITGVSTTYTTGSQAETIFVWLQGLAQVSANQSANIILNINGTNSTENAFYPTNANEWSQFSKLYMANLPANTTVTIKARALVGPGATLLVNRGAPFLASIRGFAISQ